MPPVDPSVAAESRHVPADLLAAVRQAVAEVVAQAAKPKPLLIDQSDVPAFIGVSRSCWYRWRSEGITPKPVAADGAGVKFKRLELEKFVEKMRTA